MSGKPSSPALAMAQLLVPRSIPKNVSIFKLRFSFPNETTDGLGGAEFDFGWGQDGPWTLLGGAGDTG